MPVRQLKITMAENVIVPMYGRKDGLIKPALKLAEPLQDKLIFETIGGEEAEIAKYLLEMRGYRVKRANVWAVDESNDGTRELLQEATWVYFSPKRWHGEESYRVPAQEVENLLR
jgi:hypothetical protein